MSIRKDWQNATDAIVIKPLIFFLTVMSCIYRRQCDLLYLLKFQAENFGFDYVTASYTILTQGASTVMQHAVSYLSRELEVSKYSTVGRTSK